MARPQQEVRARIDSVFDQRPSELLTWLDLLPAVPGLSPDSPADRDLVRRTVDNMGRAGAIERGTPRRVPGCARPMTTWRRADKARAETHRRNKPDATAEMQRALSAWLLTAV
jgi:hypothetical protein